MKKLCSDGQVHLQLSYLLLHAHPLASGLQILTSEKLQDYTF